VTVVSCPPFGDENVAALLNLLINKHGQNGGRHLTSVELIQVVLKDVEKQKRQKWLHRWNKQGINHKF